MGTVDVIVNNETMFRDDDVVQSIDYGSINQGDKVDIDARWGDDGAIYAPTSTSKTAQATRSKVL